MSGTSEERVLAHYGVKGMKWGVRRSDDALARAAKKREESSDDAKNAQDTKAKGAGGSHKLSNKEMQDVISRMNIERSYNQLVNPPSEMREFTTGLMKNLAKNTVTGTVTSEVNKAVRGMFDK